MLPSAALFGRQYQLSIGTPARPDLALYGNAPAPPTRHTSSLRIEFEVHKNIKETPNKAEVQITNMAAQTRGALRLGMLVKLFAGYSGRTGLLFVGAIAKVKSERQGPDIISKLELGDGESAIMDTPFDKSYPRGASLTQVLTDIAVAMQLRTAANPQGEQTGTIVGVPLKRFAKGYTAHGPARFSMTSLCQAYGLEWSMQNGAVQVVPQKHHTGESAELLNRHTGLIGAPSYDGKVMTASALLNARLTPGRLVKIESDTVNGFFKLRGGKWQGDTHGDKWQVDMEAIPMPGVVQALPASRGLPIQPTPNG